MELAGKKQNLVLNTENVMEPIAFWLKSFFFNLLVGHYFIHSPPKKMQTGPRNRKAQRLPVV